MTAGVYVHIPFCRRKCLYCGFYSVPCGKNDEALQAAYISALKEEIRCRQDLSENTGVDTIYFGGGTPSLLPDSAIKGLLDTIALRYDVLPGAEISIEINPEDISRTESFKAMGFNRLTLGVQTLDEDMHKRLGRAGRLCQAKDLEDFFSVRGVTRCIDMIIGMPGQTAALLLSDLEASAAYLPEHVSLYMLALEEGTPLAKIVETDDLLQSRRFSEAGSFLKSRGYVRYEVSNWALPGFYSKHNMKYWTFKPYIGFGAGAHSFYGGRRLFHKADLAEYIADPLVFEEDERGLEAAMAEFIMTGLRLSQGLSLSDFFAEFGAPVPAQVLSRVDREILSGNMAYSGPDRCGRLMLTEQGLLFADGIIYQILQDIL